MHFSAAVVYVDDGSVSAVLDFYQRAFGLTLRFYDPDYEFGELNSGPTSLAVASQSCGKRIAPGYEPPGPGTPVMNTELAFTTDDVEGAFERAVAAGAVAVTSPYTLPWGQLVAYVKSVEGTLIGICAPMPVASSSSSGGTAATSESVGSSP